MTECDTWTLALLLTLQFTILLVYALFIATTISGRELLYCSNFTPDKTQIFYELN